MTRVLVIGATGMLGREVVRAAASDGAEVVPTARKPQPGYVIFDAERDDPNDLLSLRVDCVVNCAAVLAAEVDPRDPSSIARARLVNELFPQALAAAVENAGSRLVQISTDAIFADEAGLCFEDTERFSVDVYGETKRLGEPSTLSALSLRCSFVGLDPTRRRGLLEWLLAQPDGGEVTGFVDQVWNGLVATQVAAACAALLDLRLFDAARAEGATHHLFEDPPLTKYALLKSCSGAFEKNVMLVPRESGSPVRRTLGSRHVVLGEYLKSVPSRAASLAELAKRG